MDSAPEAMPNIQSARWGLGTRSARELDGLNFRLFLLVTAAIPTNEGFPTQYRRFREALANEGILEPVAEWFVRSTAISVLAAGGDVASLHATLQTRNHFTVNDAVDAWTALTADNVDSEHVFRSLRSPNSPLGVHYVAASERTGNMARVAHILAWVHRNYRLRPVPIQDIDHQSWVATNPVWIDLVSQETRNLLFATREEQLRRAVATVPLAVAVLAGKPAVAPATLKRHIKSAGVRYAVVRDEIPYPHDLLQEAAAVGIPSAASHPNYTPPAAVTKNLSVRDQARILKRPTAPPEVIESILAEQRSVLSKGRERTFKTSLLSAIIESEAVTDEQAAEIIDLMATSVPEAARERLFRSWVSSAVRTRFPDIAALAAYPETVRDARLVAASRSKQDMRRLAATTTDPKALLRLIALRCLPDDVLTRLAKHPDLDVASAAQFQQLART